jgi:predicted nuclease of predicted toxin-antitoxin system
MTFFLDVCSSSHSLRALLTELGHDVRSALDVDPGASDETLLAVALRESRVLVTEDKDFGELVFVRRLPHPTIIRLVEMRVDDQVVAMRELLTHYTTELEAGTLLVVTKDRVRVRYSKQ